MQLVADWRRVLRHAWSIRWIVAAFGFSILEALTNIIDPPTAPVLRVVFGLLAGTSSAGSFFSRIAAQKEFKQ